MAKNAQQPKAVLHMLARQWQQCTNPSPFVVKLETYLRIAQIEYDVDFDKPFHPTTSKSPWLTYQGEELADTSAIIDRLMQVKGVDIDAALSADQHAIGRAFQKMIEESTYWVLVLYRWLWSKDGRALLREAVGGGGVKLFVADKIVTRQFRKQVWAQGSGRLDEGEAMKSAMRDTKAVAQLLDSGKKYLLGDEPHLVDCTVYGFYSTLLYGYPKDMPLAKMIRTEHPNLVEYVERIKNRYYPDWDQLIKKPLKK